MVARTLALLLLCASCVTPTQYYDPNTTLDTLRQKYRSNPNDLQAARTYLTHTASHCFESSNHQEQCRRHATDAFQAADTMAAAKMDRSERALAYSKKGEIHYGLGKHLPAYQNASKSLKIEYSLAAAELKIRSQLKLGGKEKAEKDCGQVTQLARKRNAHAQFILRCAQITGTKPDNLPFLSKKDQQDVVDWVNRQIKHKEKERRKNNEKRNCRSDCEQEHWSCQNGCDGPNCRKACENRKHRCNMDCI